MVVRPVVAVHALERENVPVGLDAGRTTAGGGQRAAETRGVRRKPKVESDIAQGERYVCAGAARNRCRGPVFRFAAHLYTLTSLSCGVTTTLLRNCAQADHTTVWASEEDRASRLPRRFASERE